MTCFPQDSSSKSSRFQPSALDGKSPQSTLLIILYTSCCVFTLGINLILFPSLLFLYIDSQAKVSSSFKNGFEFIIHNSTSSFSSKAFKKTSGMISCPFLTSHFPQLKNIVLPLSSISQGLKTEVSTPSGIT